MLLGESQLSGYSESSARRRSALRTFRTWFAIQLSETDAFEKTAKKPGEKWLSIHHRQGAQSLFRIGFESIEFFKKYTAFGTGGAGSRAAVESGLQTRSMPAEFDARQCECRRGTYSCAAPELEDLPRELVAGGGTLPALRAWR